MDVFPSVKKGLEWASVLVLFRDPKLPDADAAPAVTRRSAEFRLEQAKHGMPSAELALIEWCSKLGSCLIQKDSSVSLIPLSDNGDVPKLRYDYNFVKDSDTAFMEELELQLTFIFTGM